MLNEVHAQNLKKDGQLEARLQAYELAYQMQMEATDAFDITKEPKATQDVYGTNTQQGRQMLIARRLLDKGADKKAVNKKGLTPVAVARASQAFVRHKDLEPTVALLAIAGETAPTTNPLNSTDRLPLQNEGATSVRP